MTAYAEIMVTVPVDGRFVYIIPEHLTERLSVGHRVAVPFGRRRITGFVSSVSSAPPEGMDKKLRKISDLLDDEPLLSDDLLAIVSFASEFYLAPIGEVLKVALPPGLTAASIAALRITPRGKDVLEGTDATAGLLLSDQERSILSRAAKPAGIKKKDVPAKLLERLTTSGLLSHRERFDVKEAVETVEVVSRTDRGFDEEAIASLSRAPVQRKLIEAIREEPTPAHALIDVVGPTAFRRTLKALESKGLVVRSRLPKEHFSVAEAPQQLESPLSLTPSQAAVLNQILDAMRTDKKTAFLLRGVTGSGKTEVYLQAIADARAKNQGAVVLVPEIALTSQLASRFMARFGREVVVLHSALSDLERRRRWHLLRTGQASIALGPRSAVWAPVQNVGIIVVDEEHDASFKQNTELRYSGRDLALLRASKANAVCVLGSATPSLEARQLAKSGRLVELTLAERVQGRPLPTVETVDLSQEPKVDGEVPILTRALSDALLEVVSAKEQAILFLNRRGFNTVVVCEECTEIRRCENCSIALTLHKANRTLVCHYCGHKEPLSSPCPSCKSLGMRPYGVGTERIEEAVKEIAKDARVLRLDRDITQKAGALEDTLEKFRSGAADVLVGTQMVAKGHDFPDVTLVGIICADTSLAFPDFRATERTFQLLTQVAGRAGRAERPGRVFVQTFHPEHYAIRCALTHDDDGFFEIENEIRLRAGYPPHGRVGIVRIESENLEQLDRASQRIGRLARDICATSEELRVFGPTPAPIERIKSRSRRMMMLLAPTPSRLVAAMRKIKQGSGKLHSAVHVIFDVDALDML